MNTKACTVCGKEKTLDEFYKRNNRPCGYSSQCIECEKKYKKANAEHIYNQNKQYRAENIELYRESDRKRQGTEKRLAQKREWGKTYYQHKKEREPDYYLVKCRERQNKVKISGSFSRDEWEELCAKYDYRCLMCGEQKPLSVDHVIPLLLGGNNTIDNIQPLCQPCNSRKGTRALDFRNKGTVARKQLFLLGFGPK